jgi:DNA repair exonuclease SbcCD ATPase subunit/DNA repair exonuclease SbcCD nuclease subunit
MISTISHLKTVVHLADIHVRLYKRHEEYREVFDILYDQLQRFKGRDDVAILVAGDINHAKTDMSPEMVQLSSEFLSKLAEIAPTIVIAGNHDLNLANLNRLDSLTPIIDNIGSPNLHYFKDSGVYPVGDAEFAVMSIIGDRSDWPAATDCSTDTKIALYHGPVYSAQTDVGYTVSSRAVSITDFDGFDITMLGDIHRHQVLQAADPIVVYAGSLIQQNHGETLRGHGWVEWDIPSRSFVFHEVVNPYGYITLEAKGDTLPLPADMPKNARIRLFVEDVDASAIKKMTSVLRKKANVVDLVINRLGAGGISSLTNNVLTDDIHDVEYQNSLIAAYLAEQFPSTSAETLDKVLELNKTLNRQLLEDDLPRNVMWKPLFMKFDNLFSYGEGNSINFQDMTGLYGVFSPNATGKTSAFDALCFALYDKTPRAFKGSHIMNTRADECYCELLFDISGQTYKIIREGERRKNGEVKVDVEFYRKDGEEWTNLSGEDRRDTNSIIRSYVGDYEDFILTSLSVQNQNSLFIDKGQTDRKDLLSQFMGLTIFDRLYALAAEESKEVAGALKRFNREDFTQALVDVQDEIVKTNAEYDTLTEQLDDSKAQLNVVIHEIAREYEKKIPVDLDVVDIDALNKSLESKQKRIDETTDEVTILVKNREDVEEQLKAARMKMPSPEDIKDLNIQYDTYTKNLKQRQTYEGELQILLHREKDYQKKIDALAEHEYDPNCQYCVNNVFVKDATQAAKQILVVQDQIQQKKRLIDALMSDADGEDILTRRAEFDKLTTKTSQLDKIRLSRQLDEERAKTKLSELSRDIMEIEVKIASYKRQEAAILHNKEIEAIIDDLDLRKKQCQKDIARLEGLARTTSGLIEVAKTRKEDMLRKIREAEELESTYEAYEYYMAAISRDGLPYQLISRVIPSIQVTVNNILAQVVDFTVQLEVDGKNINGKIVYDTNKTWPLELASGMEKFVSSLAIRIALMKISSLPRSNFIIIDEGLGVLDSDNLASMFMLFDMLRAEFDFLILISHLDVVRDIAENLVEIKRHDGYSYITIA